MSRVCRRPRDLPALHTLLLVAFGSDLLADYQRAKDDEAYASLPAVALNATIGFSLQRIVTRDQPLVFNGSDILNERWPWSPDGFAAEPQRSGHLGGRVRCVQAW